MDMGGALGGAAQGAMGGAALGPMGMGIGALASFLPSLFGGMLNQNDPQERFRRQMMQLMSPQNLGQQTNTLYNQALQSPAYAQAQRGAFAQGNAMTGSLNRALGNRGLSTSGIGAIAPSLAGAASGGMLNNLRTQAYGQAGDQAQNMIGQQVRMQSGLGAPIAHGQQLFGAGMSSFMPMLMQYLSKQQPQQQQGGGMGGMGPGMGQSFGPWSGGFGFQQ